MEKRETRRQPKERSAHEKMVQGSAWMTAGSVMSRILGAVYIIPWWIWMGSSQYAANALFTKGYQIYAIFIIISTAGIPGAVSKQIARYDAMGEYNTSMRLFWHGMSFTSIMGVVSASLMWLFAPVLADGDPHMMPVIHSLCLALVIIPMLSIMRGFFQGHSEMAPSALSQFVEQLVRVGYMLATAYLIMRVGNHNYVHAVTQSTFAAFVGAIAGIILLWSVFLFRLPALRRRNAQSLNKINVSVNTLMMDIVRQAVPFIIMDSAIQWYYVIDQFTFWRGMKSLYSTTNAQLSDFFAMYAGNANKLIMIVVSLATAMAVTAIPLLSGAITKGNKREVAKQITSILQLFFFVMLPASFGMMAISHPLYVGFYDFNPTGFKMLEVSSVLAIFLGLFTILSALLQGLFRNRLAIKLMLVGVAVKLLCQLPFMYLFSVYGPMLSTLAGMLVSCVLMLHYLRVLFHFNVRQTAKRILGMLVFSLMMFVGARLTVWLLSFVLNPHSKIQSFVIVIGAVIVGAGIYAYFALKTRLADTILGSRVAGIRRRLHMN
ncbi:polysaccharide biosynthesis protein [Lacticaseibacillus pabuli]|uniref:Polysaccharide biosynthesis protein n=1 Tax=Lacticaseibacillus pabuli TaxID=3025672 RepID=A0ABY7WPD6_9LACO|nr:polysaccharide biosynthesis protein [Lacticaseibacillus sp. KACC 23028]WDF82034.1 polysaccharide biosynthesis protein [Lacticaseibacillus sp. KACC 23028]